MITRRDREYSAIMSRRALIFGGLQGLAVAGLASRLYYLQLVEGQQYSRLSDSNKYDFRIITPSRGRIYDSGGRLLAGNAEAYQLSLIPDYVEDVEAVLRMLSRLIALDDEAIAGITTEVESSPSFLPVTIRADLTQREVARLVVRTPELPGVAFEKIQKRIYPQGFLAAHVTGYVNRVTKEEISAGTITRELAMLNTGKSGVEKSFEPNLRGTPGRERVLVNAYGRPIHTAVDEESHAGSDVTLTADMDLQNIALEALKKGRNKPVPREDPRVQEAIRNQPELAYMIPETEEFAYLDGRNRVVPPESGSVVVLDVNTGAVRCLASTPTFDPNLFAGRIRPDEWKAMVENPRLPLLNRALVGQYAPGSTFKMVVALAAMEAGVITENTLFHCPGHKTVGDQRFHCWRRGGHGTLNLRQALERSCDVFFYETGIRAGIDKIAAMGSKLGLGGRTGIDMPEEKPGLMPTRQWKAEKIGGPWTLGETVNVAIGQGYALVTPIQLAVMTARLASGGLRIQPRIVDDGRPSGFGSLDLDPGAVRIVQQGMRRVMSGSNGTARSQDIKAGMAGKTGTVQVRAISKAERDAGIVDNADRPWKYRDHALFVGYAPYEDPRYAVSVLVEHGGSGSGNAAPVAKRVLSWLMEEGA